MLNLVLSTLKLKVNNLLIKHQYKRIWEISAYKIEYVLAIKEKNKNC